MARHSPREPTVYPFDPDTTPISVAREHFFNNFYEGLHCVVCGRWGQLYDRRIDSNMVRSLRWMVWRFNQNGGNWIHIKKESPRHVIKNSEITTTKYWNLVEPLENTGDHYDPEKRDIGYWRPTEHAIPFLRGEFFVHKSLLVFNDTVYFPSIELVTVRDSIGRRFTYNRLMDGWKDEGPVTFMAANGGPVSLLPPPQNLPPAKLPDHLAKEFHAELESKVCRDCAEDMEISLDNNPVDT